LAVAELLVRGKRYKDIGRALGISPSTVTNHVNQIHARLGITKREELVGLFNPEC
jgi:DNA-binding CsgD family transcriptional regulator